MKLINSFKGIFRWYMHEIQGTCSVSWETESCLQFMHLSKINFEYLPVKYHKIRIIHQVHIEKIVLS